jgi:hypothetical protein
MIPPVECTICSTPLTSPLSRQNRVCEQLTCQAEHGRRQSQKAKAERQQQRDDISDRVRKEHKLPVNIQLSVVVPSNQQRVVPLPENRREKFLMHLARVVEEGFSGDAVEVDEYVTQESIEFETDSAESELLGQACALCRGYCCSGGSEHAFIDQETIRHVRARHPGIGADELTRSYLSFLPQRSFDGACGRQVAGGNSSTRGHAVCWDRDGRRPTHDLGSM